MKPAARMTIAVVLFIAILLIGKRVLAALTTKASAPVTTISQIGPHTPILKVEKNENPQNSMIVYTKIDPETCAFAKAPGAGTGPGSGPVPVLDEYWMMDGKQYKKVNPLIKSGIQKRFDLDQQAFKDGGRFLVKLRDFHELKSDLGDEPMFEVLSVKAPGGCSAKVEMKLGPSDKNRTLAIESIYADSSKKLLPPFRKLNSLTLIGRDVATDEVVRRTYLCN